MKDKDVYLPVWILGLGIFLLAVACACIVLSFTLSSVMYIIAILFIPLGIAAVLCWRNQWIEMTGSNEFVYSTMFGSKKTYSFSEIIGLKNNPDSIDLVMESGKVHIEACAVVSDRFRNALENRLRIIYPE